MTLLEEFKEVHGVLDREENVDFIRSKTKDMDPYEKDDLFTEYLDWLKDNHFDDYLWMTTSKTEEWIYDAERKGADEFHCTSEIGEYAHYCKIEDDWYHINERKGRSFKGYGHELNENGKINAIEFDTECDCLSKRMDIVEELNDLNSMYFFKKGELITE